MWCAQLVQVQDMKVLKIFQVQMRHLLSSGLFTSRCALDMLAVGVTTLTYWCKLPALLTKFWWIAVSGLYSVIQVKCVVCSVSSATRYETALKYSKFQVRHRLSSSLFTSQCVLHLLAVDQTSDLMQIPLTTSYGELP